jgi:hypothetical protein
MDPYVGKYFSLEYMRRQILKQPDALFKDIDKDMAQEIKDGKVIDPMTLPQMEVEQMAMSLQPEEVDPQQQAMDQYAQGGIDQADRKKGDF